MAAPRDDDIETRECFGPKVFNIHAREGEKPLEVARTASDAYGRLPIWSLDLPNPDDDLKKRGRKCFVVASYSMFRDVYREAAAADRCYYEILLKNIPTRIYVDVDVQPALNLTLSPAVTSEMLGVLIAEIEMLANEIAVAAGDKPIPRTPVRLDSSKPSKLSKHLVFDFFLRNNYHCGAAMRTVRNRIVAKFEKAPGTGDRDKDHPYYLWVRVKDPTKRGETMLVRTFFADLAVYTKRRNFRIYGSSKRIAGALPLLAEGEDGFHWDTFDRCILQRRSNENRVYDCLESDGSVPISTSDTNFLRADGVQAESRKKVGGAKRGATTGAFVEAPHLAEHWSKVFPFDTVFNVIAPAPPGAGRREFRFTDAGGKWTAARYFNNAVDFRGAVLTAQPGAVHIGPVRDPSTGARWDVVPFQPSLAFDVDIKDYATFRPCCGSTGAACKTCWPIAAFAQRAVAAFINTCGLGTALTFFSGSKGVHIWAVGRRDLTTAIAGEAKRRALIELFHLPTATAAVTSDDGDVQMNTAASYEIPSQQALCGLDFVQAALGDEASRASLTTFICRDMGLDNKFRAHAVEHGRDSAIVRVLWPKLDDDVTASPAHMIKAPFCVHPRTARVCVWLETPDVNPYAQKIDGAQNAAAFTKVCQALRQ